MPCWRALSILVRAHDHGHPHVNELRGEEEVALQIGRVHDIDHQIGLAREDIVAGHRFIQTARIAGIHRVGAGQIDDGDPFAVMLIAAFLAFDGNPWPIANMLAGTGQSIEEGGLPAIGVAGKGEAKICHGMVQIKLRNPHAPRRGRGNMVCYDEDWSRPF